MSETDPMAHTTIDGKSNHAEATVWCSAVLAALLAGCVSAPPIEPASDADRKALLSGELLFDRPIAASELPEDRVLELSDAMRKFIDPLVAPLRGKKAKLQALLEAVINPGVLGLQYDPVATYSAAGTFAQRRANCLSFTTMMIAMSRYMGLEAQFNEVDVPPLWDLHDETTLVLYRHINAVVHTEGGSRQMLDFAMEEYDASYQQRFISDRLAEAQYYNNRAVELLYGDNYRDAFRYLKKALILEPEVSYLWANLGTLYRRAGHLDTAARAYRVALELDGGDLIALSNAARLYRQLGDDEQARALEEKAGYFRLRNPYFRYKLALDAFRQGDYAHARREALAALRLHRTEHRFHFLLGAIYCQLGQVQRAGESMRRAIELAAEPRQRSSYERKMELLLSAN